LKEALLSKNATRRNISNNLQGRYLAIWRSINFKVMHSQKEWHICIDYEIVVVYNDYEIIVNRDDFNIVVRSKSVIITTTIKNSYNLGQVIQQSRMQQGFSQRELAKMLGVSQKWVWEMEQGKHGLLMERLFMVLEKTGVTLSAEFDVEGMLNK